MRGRKVCVFWFEWYSHSPGHALVIDPPIPGLILERNCSSMPTAQEPKSLRFHAGSELRLNDLSEKRQQIIRPVLENPREFVLLNVRDMAHDSRRHLQQLSALSGPRI